MKKENFPRQTERLASIDEEADGFSGVVQNYYGDKHLRMQEENYNGSVRQPNELTRGFYKCSAVAQKLFVVTVSQFMKLKKTSKDRWITLELSDVIYGLNIRDGKQTRELFKKSVNEVGDLSVIMKDDDHEFYRINLFEEVKFNWDWGTLKYKLSEKFSQFLEDEHKSGFTIFGLEMTGKLQSFYSIRYYEIAMSYFGFKGECKDISQWAKDNGVDKENSWFFAYSVNQLRALFRIREDEYADTRNLKKKVVMSPVEEINKKIPSISIKVETVYQRRKIQGFIFWVTENSADRKSHRKNEGAREKQEVEAVNRDALVLESYKAKFPREFAEALEQVRAEGQGGFRFEMLEEAEAVRILRSRGLEA